MEHEIDRGMTAETPDEGPGYTRAEARRDVEQLVADRARAFEAQLGGVLRRAEVYIGALSLALGRLPRGEAVDALRRFIDRELEALR